MRKRDEFIALAGVTGVRQRKRVAFRRRSRRRCMRQGFQAPGEGR